MIKNIKNYLWFLKESQAYMKRSYAKNKILNAAIVFIISIPKGINFCKMINNGEV
jgi:hypothetical protein